MSHMAILSFTQTLLCVYTICWLQNGQRMAAIQGMQGVSMLAGSPVRHLGDPNLQLNPVDVRNYHQPPPAWKALESFAIQNDLRHSINGGGGNIPGDPGHDTAGAFQQLVCVVPLGRYRLPEPGSFIGMRLVSNSQDSCRLIPERLDIQNSEPRATLRLRFGQDFVETKFSSSVLRNEQHIC